MGFVKLYALEAKSGRSEELLEALRALRAVLGGLEGNLGSEILQNAERNECFHFLERWESREAQEAAGQLLPRDVMAQMQKCLGCPPISLSLKLIPVAS